MKPRVIKKVAHSYMRYVASKDPMAPIDKATGSTSPPYKVGAAQKPVRRQIEEMLMHTLTIPLEKFSAPRTRQ